MSHRLTRDGLVAAFHGYGRERARWLTGAEFERHLLDPAGRPLPYHGVPGVHWLLRALQERDGWKPLLEGDNIIALAGGVGGANVTLEPGGQFELSGGPSAELEDIHAEADGFSSTVAELLAPHGIRQVALGFTPRAAIPDVQWVPKGRYVIMREHLAETGALAHHMMKGTCAVQASYDYADEADCARKVQLATGIGPLTTAMFANSPITEGRINGYMSFRGHIWTETDPARTGLPDAAAEFSFERWVDYLLDAPMMFRRDDAGGWVSAKGQTFRGWMTSDRPPGAADWDLHQTSVFPEVRVKRQIEVRGADCVQLDLAMAFVALFKGLFYCNRALDEATELMHRFTACGTRSERFAEACRDGLRGEVGDRRLADWCEELIELSDAALERCAPEDRRWLLPLIQQIERGESPARTLLAEWDGSLPHLLECTELRTGEAPPSVTAASSDRNVARGLKAARLAERVVGLSRRARQELKVHDPSGRDLDVRDARRQLKKLRKVLQSVQEQALETGMSHHPYAALCQALRPFEAQLDDGGDRLPADVLGALAIQVRTRIRQALDL